MYNKLFFLMVVFICPFIFLKVFKLHIDYTRKWNGRKAKEEKVMTAKILMIGTIAPCKSKENTV